MCVQQKTNGAGDVISIIQRLTLNKGIAMLNAEFNFTETTHTHKCERCGILFTPKFGAKNQIYCSRKCFAVIRARLSANATKERFNLKYEQLKDGIIADYNAGKTLSGIASKIPKCNKGTISKLLKQWGEFDASRKKPQHTKGFNGHCKIDLESKANREIANSIMSELKSASATDDCKHWLRHPTCRNHFVWNRTKINPSMRILKSIRCRIHKTVIRQGHTKSERTLSLLGCDIETVRLHLESKFKLGMSWDNYGKWEIDHIIPCSAFDMRDTSQQRACFNYLNLQPLWKADNISKGGINRVGYKKIKQFL